MENKTLKVTLTKSLIGRHPKHVKTAHSLNLRKVGDSSVQPDNACTQGKLTQISYLIKVED